MRNVQHQAWSVIPPHIWRHMAEHGDDDARERIASTLYHSQLISPPAVPPAPLPNGRKRSVDDAGPQRHLPGKLVMDDQRAGHRADHRPSAAASR